MVSTGLPVAYFIFSAPELAKRASANYDHHILERFLKKWRDCVTASGPSSQGQPAQIFTPKVCERFIFIVICADHFQSTFVLFTSIESVCTEFYVCVFLGIVFDRLFILFVQFIPHSRLEFFSKLFMIAFSYFSTSY